MEDFLINKTKIFLMCVFFFPCTGLKLYSNQFVIRVRGDRNAAETLSNEYGLKYLGQMLYNLHHIKYEQMKKISFEKNYDLLKMLVHDDRLIYVKQLRVLRREKRDLLHFNDPMWPEMWHLNRKEGLGMKLPEAWQKATGKGVVIAVIDDGFEKDHPDLIRNYDQMASFDFADNDEDPSPVHDLLNPEYTSHGTKCAGIAAAVANNGICSIGTAFNSKIGGIRIFGSEDFSETDAREHQSIRFRNDKIDIYSVSWGVSDDGQTVEGPETLALLAFHDGITKGRNGLGSIYVWSSGNGGLFNDNCNCDGYVNSIFTISVSPVSEFGKIPYYSEPCSPTLISTYSSGSVAERKIISTSTFHSCTKNFGSTSACAPQAAGICALALEVNPLLNWRDMQHLIVNTADTSYLQSFDWSTNGVNRNFSHFYGFGLMNADSMVKYAKNWKTVPEQKICKSDVSETKRYISAGERIEVNVNLKCKKVHFLEHVQLRLSIKAKIRGALFISLISPMGTKSTLLTYRRRDISKEGFVNWPFMSVHFWGEDPTGRWKINISYGRQFDGQAILTSYRLICFGTTYDPVNYNLKKHPLSLLKTPKLIKDEL